MNHLYSVFINRLLDGSYKQLIDTVTFARDYTSYFSHRHREPTVSVSGGGRSPPTTQQDGIHVGRGGWEGP